MIASVLFRKFGVETAGSYSPLGMHRDRVYGPLAMRATEAWP